MFGGVGVAVGAHPLQIRISTKIGRGATLGGLGEDDPLSGRVLDAVQRVLPANAPAVHLDFIRTPPRHVGLGSGTLILLGAVASIDAVFDVGLDRSTIQRSTRRGGASGVGVHSFFTGGFVFDGGHPLKSRSKSRFMPSTFLERTQHDVPPLISRIPAPNSWHVALLCPTEFGAMSGTEEEQFFKTRLPLQREDALVALSHVYHGIAPSLIAKDLRLFRRSLHSLQDVGLKRLEIERLAPQQRDVLRRIRKLPRVAAGLSSFGPLVFAVLEADDSQSRASIEKVCSNIDVAPVWASFANNGYTVSKIVGA